MSKGKSTTKNKRLDAGSNTLYRSVIADAEGMIARLRVLTGQLERSVQTFKTMRKEGAPFPGQGQLGQPNDL